VAIQLAAQAGARVIGVTRPASADQALALGVAEVIDRDGNIAAQVQMTRGPVDAALDVVGGPAAHMTIAAVRNGGRYATVVPFAQAPGSPETPVRGIIPQEVLIRQDPAGLRNLSGLLGAGSLTLSVGGVLPLDRAAEAHRLVESHSRPVPAIRYAER
jgi:NADPH:quinone reductase-like Zn-dependent oxidoreductase